MAMKIKYKFLFVTLFFGMVSLSQETTSEEQLDEILITSSRIDLPFSENSRTITLITSEDLIQKLGYVPVGLGETNCY